MDQEREDYADRDLPPPRPFPPLEIIFGLVGAAFLAVMVAAFLLNHLVMAYAG
jgi:hypothetical protein